MTTMRTSTRKRISTITSMTKTTTTIMILKMMNPGKGEWG